MNRTQLEKKNELLLNALEHSLICSLAQDCFRIMKDEPDKITACEGCRLMLMVWRIEVLERMVHHGV